MAREVRNGVLVQAALDCVDACGLVEQDGGAGDEPGHGLGLGVGVGEYELSLHRSHADHQCRAVGWLGCVRAERVGEGRE
jgi:hypothetical protein